MSCLWASATDEGDQMGVIGGLSLLVVWLVVDVGAGEGDTSRIVAVVGVGVEEVNTGVVAAAINS